jgi:hypothetical protein
MATYTKSKDWGWVSIMSSGLPLPTVEMSLSAAGLTAGQHSKSGYRFKKTDYEDPSC